MAKSKVFWVTRDDIGNAAYEIWPYKRHPQQDESGEYPMDSEHGFCCNNFETLTGITLAPGERVKARLIIQET